MISYRGHLITPTEYSARVIADRLALCLAYLKGSV